MKVYKIKFNGAGLNLVYNVKAKHPEDALKVAKAELQKDYQKAAQIPFVSIDVIVEYLHEYKY